MSRVAHFLSRIARPQDALRILGVGRVQPHPRWHIGRQRHQFHELIVVVGGSMIVEAHGRRVTAGAGDVLFYAAGMRHEEWSDPTDPVETFFFAFTAGGLKLPFKGGDPNGRIRELARWAHEERERPSPGSADIQNAALRIILVEFRQSLIEKPDLVRSTRRYMKDHLREDISLGDLASLARISKFHFLRRYKALTGRTPMHDLRVVRAEAARDMIRHTELPLKAVAQAVGFANEYHLSRVFKNHFNVPPGYFRK